MTISSAKAIPTPSTQGTESHVKAGGFTLIEVMIVVAVIAILASIALPSYQQHVMTTYRASAKACMSEFAQAYERRYTTNMTYVGEAIVLACQTESNLDNRYTITAAATATTYALTATPIGAQVKDTVCGTLSLNQTGAKGATDATKCW